MSSLSTLSNTDRGSAQDAALALGVSVWTVYRLIADEQIATMRVRGRHQILMDSVRAYLDANTTTTDGPTRNGATP